MVLEAGARAGSVLAFEPSGSAYALLESRFSQEPRVRSVRAALGQRSGTMQFFEEPDAGKGSTLVPGFIKTQGRVHDVEVTTFDDAMRQMGWDHADVLKIDAEGFDLQVMRGAHETLARGGVDIIQFEYNRAWQLACDTLHGAYALLEPFGYQIFVLKRDGLYTLDYARYEEYFEYTNYVALSKRRLPLFADRMRGVI